MAYSSVNENDTILILNELKKFCNGTADPEVRAPDAVTEKHFYRFFMDKNTKTKMHSSLNLAF